MGFLGKLRPFQIPMALFMCNKKRVVNCSDTGLGKTVEALAAAEKLKELKLTEKCLIICLKSLKLQWQKRINQFTDNTAVLIDGDAATRVDLLNKAATNGSYYVIMNYEQTHKEIRNLWKFLETVRREKLIIVCDEVSKIKNHQTKTAVRIKTLWARWMWGLTASPVENRPDELFSIVNWLDAELFGSWSKFEKQYIVRNYFGGIASYRNLDELAKKVKPLLKKNTRAEVQDQLPELTFKQYDVQLSPDEKNLYNTVRDDLMADLDLIKEAQEEYRIIERGIDVDVDDIEQSLAQLDLGIHKKHFEIMSKFLSLRMLCCHPLLLEQSSSDYARERFKTQPVRKSSKLDVLIEILDTLLKEPKSKVVIFSLFTRMLAIMAQRLKTEFPTIKFVQFIGPMSAKERAQAQDEFNTDPNVRIILCSDAGGYGVDLPAGNYLVNFDLPWHFGKLAQRNRIQRIGSAHQKNVIINLIVENSVEERMMELIERKKELGNILIDGAQIPEDSYFTLNKTTLKQFLVSRGEL